MSKSPPRVLFLFTAIAATSADPLEVDISSLLASWAVPATNSVANAGRTNRHRRNGGHPWMARPARTRMAASKATSGSSSTGVTLAKMQPRIINGAKASLGQFPWQVALLTDLNDSFNSQGLRRIDHPRKMDSHRCPLLRPGRRHHLCGRSLD